MFQINSRKIIGRLSNRSLKYNKSRNLIAVLAIILTAVLFTSLFTIGGSMIDSFQRSTMRQVGTTAHGGFKFLTREQYDIVAADPKVKDISYNIIIGFGENPELHKTMVEIRYTEEKAAQWSFTMPTTGRLPQNRLDVAASTGVLDALGLPHQLGIQVPLEFTANGKKYQETFTLCGFWEQDVAMEANEVFLSREYCDEVAPVWHESKKGLEDNSYWAGCINPSLWFATSWDLEQQMADLKDRCGFGEEVNEGVNWAYSTSAVDATTMVLLVGILLLIILSGYLIIYNIFYISVSKDIRFYGLLKTIGTTNRQLKRIVRRQAFLLCIIGIPLGLLVGYICSRFLVPTIVAFTSIEEDYVITANPIIFIASVCFTLLTVWISCIKPCHLVASVSPVEAVRYTEKVGKKRKKTKKTKRVSSWAMAWGNVKRTPKKTTAVVLSLSLSLILLNGTVTLVKGFDMNRYVENMVVSDFYITDASIINLNSANTVYNGVTKETQNEINRLPGIIESGNVYMQETMHRLSETVYERALPLATELSKQMQAEYTAVQMNLLNEEQSMFAHLYGVDAFTAGKVNITKGELNWEKLATGRYIIVSALGDGLPYDVGDQIIIDFENGKKKQYEVMAIGDLPSALSPGHGHFIDINFILSGEEFQAQTGETGALKMAFNVESAAYDDTEMWLNNYCEEVNPDLAFRSKDTYVEEFRGMQNTFLVVGGVLSFILAFIGILNFINSMVTSVQTRRQELSVLQAIGMTGKQMKQMLVGEGLCYTWITILAVITMGSLLNYGLVTAVANQIWFFQYHFMISPILLCLPVFLLFAILIPILCYHSMCKNSIVDRLRECES